MKPRKLVLILIFIFGFILRSIYIDKFPPSLNWDEVSHGYNAYSLLKTGRDEWGSFLPLIFRAYGDYKLPLYIYLTIPSIFVFGLTPFSIRLVSIVAGSLLPVLIYLIVSKILPKDTKIPLFAALICLFSPGTLFLSRIALEANLFAFLFCLSLYFLITKKYSLSSFIYGLSLFTYNSSRALLPFFIISLIYFLVKNKYPLKKNLLHFLPFLIFITLTAWQMLNQSGQARYQWVSLLDSGSINRINELRQTYPRILVNKLTFFTYQTGKNYLSHFNPLYLFFRGGSHYQFNIPHFYLLSPLLIPFLILGLVYLLKHFKKNPQYQLLLFWLLVAPLPSAITRDAPHVLRSIIFIPIVIIITAIGFTYLNHFQPKLSTTYLIVILIISQIQFWSKYTMYSQTYASSWQYGYQQVVNYVKSVYSDYDQILITKKYGEPHEFFLFYWPWPPHQYHTDPAKVWDYHANWYWIDKFDKFRFINDWDILTVTQSLPSDQNILLITSPHNYNPKIFKKIKTINFLDNNPAFDILSYE
jgi:4-amino-4-deoxy-L-arabinose transferase-like glycosyltransferase